MKAALRRRLGLDGLEGAGSLTPLLVLFGLNAVLSFTAFVQKPLQGTISKHVVGHVPDQTLLHGRVPVFVGDDLTDEDGLHSDAAVIEVNVNNGRRAIRSREFFPIRNYATDGAGNTQPLEPPWIMPRVKFTR